jgi:hypothetical protein
MEDFVPKVPACRTCILKLWNDNVLEVPALVASNNLILKESLAEDNLDDAGLPPIEIDLSEFPLTEKENMMLVLRMQWTDSKFPLKFVEKDRNATELIHNLVTGSNEALEEYMSVMKTLKTVDQLMEISHLADYMNADKMIDLCFLKMNLILINGESFSNQFLPLKEARDVQKLLNVL